MNNTVNNTAKISKVIHHCCICNEIVSVCEPIIVADFEVNDLDGFLHMKSSMCKECSSVVSRCFYQLFPVYTEEGGFDTYFKMSIGRSCEANTLFTTINVLVNEGVISIKTAPFLNWFDSFYELITINSIYEHGRFYWRTKNTMYKQTTQL